MALHKELEAENMRTRMQGGMSERDAAMVSMKNTKKQRKDNESPISSGGSGPDYPYGLSVSLEKESLDKLGMKTLPDVGDTFTMTAKVKVTSVNQSASEDGDHRSASLQITDMKLA